MRICSKIIVFLCLLICCSMGQTIQAMDITTDLYLTNFITKEQSMHSEAYGNLFVKLLDKEDVVSDFQYQFGDNRDRINVCSVKFIRPNMDIIIGRQLYAWGSGYNFNPTDVFNAKPIGAAFDPTYIKTGRDSITITAYPIDDFFIDFIYAPKYTLTNVITRTDPVTNITKTGQDDRGIRFKTNLYDYDVSLSYMELGQRAYNSMIEENDKITGFSIKGTLPILNWGIWTEIASYKEQDKQEYVVGTEYFLDQWTFILEYYKNEFGASSKANYNLGHILTGKMLAQDYFIPALSYLYDEKLTLTAFTFINNNDSSYITGGVLDYFYNDTIEIILMPFLINGDSDTEFGLQRETYGWYGLQGSVKLVF